MPTFKEFFGSTFSYWGDLLLGVEPDNGERERIRALEKLAEYYAGIQPEQIRTKIGKENDNVILNHSKKVVQKSSNMLAGGEIKFDFGEDEDSQAYIDEVYRLNRKNIILLTASRMAGKYGTGYFKINPGYFGEGGYPKLERPHPLQMKILTKEDDKDIIVGYRQQYTFIRNRKEIAHKQETLLEEYLVAGEDGIATESRFGWIIKDYETGTTGRWELVNATEFPYPFPPLIHWQNEPTDESVYGESDIGGVLDLQDKINYNASKIGKIIRYHAHPKLWGRGFNAKSTKNWGEDEVIVIPNESGQMGSIEMSSDLSSSMIYLNSLVQDLYDLTSTVNLSTIKDKLGQLTNFGLRVLYQDSLEKLYSKRLTFGEALIELNRRLLVLNDESYEGDGGSIVWPSNVIPENQDEESQLIERDLNNGLVSKETARTLRGYENDQEVERLANEETDIGSIIINALNRGQ